MAALDAAKAYLKKFRDARPFSEILDAVKSGGGKVENEEKLRVGLSRSTLDVVKINDRYGWLDNYPEEKARRTRGFRKAGPEESRPEEPRKEDAESVPENDKAV